MGHGSGGNPTWEELVDIEKESLENVMEMECSNCDTSYDIDKVEWTGDGNPICPECGTIAGSDLGDFYA